MADIVISYARPEWESALTLSASLESEGWSVWLDQGWEDRDPYRAEVTKQLALARAAIVIWSEASIHSDYVLANADRARADGKLISIKQLGLTDADIPLPFRKMQIVSTLDTERIKASVRVQLAKPSALASASRQATPASASRQTTPASTLWLVLSIIKSSVVTWGGIIGLAITLFANLETALKLADWARVLVDHWQQLTAVFWGTLFGWIGVRIPPFIVPYLSFTLFAILLVIGINLSSLNESDILVRPWKLTRFLFGICGYLGGLSAIVAMSELLTPYHFATGHWVAWLAALPKAWSICFPFIFVPLTATGEQRKLVLTALLVFTVIAGCLLFYPLEAIFGVSEEINYKRDMAGFILYPVVAMTAISFTPIKSLIKGLTFVVIGLGILLISSEISKLNLHEYLIPPKHF